MKKRYVLILVGTLIAVNSSVLGANIDENIEEIVEDNAVEQLESQNEIDLNEDTDIISTENNDNENDNYEISDEFIIESVDVYDMDEMVIGDNYESGDEFILDSDDVEEAEIEAEAFSEQADDEINMESELLDDAEIDTEKNYEYEVIDNEVYIVKYIGNDAEVVLPSKIAGYPVTVIGDYAFDGCDTLKSIVIPETVTRLGSCIIRGTSVTSIIIPNNINFPTKSLLLQ